MCEIAVVFIISVSRSRTLVLSLWSGEVNLMVNVIRVVLQDVFLRAASKLGGCNYLGKNLWTEVMFWGGKGWSRYLFFFGVD